MRNAAVIEQVLNRAEKPDDEVDVRECRGQEARGDAAWNRARRRVGTSAQARDERARQSVGQCVHARSLAKSARALPYKSCAAPPRDLIALRA